jgi:putative transposase
MHPHMTTRKKKAQRRRRAPGNKVTARYRSSEALWAVRQPVLPVRQSTHRFGGGRPRVPDRQCADAIC